MQNAKKKPPWFKSTLRNLRRRRENRSSFNSSNFISAARLYKTYNRMAYASYVKNIQIRFRIDPTSFWKFAYNQRPLMSYPLQCICLTFPSRVTKKNVKPLLITSVPYSRMLLNLHLTLHQLLARFPFRGRAFIVSWGSWGGFCYKWAEAFVCC